MQIVAKQQDKELKEQFSVDVSLYKPHILVFEDETGTDCRDELRRYGYSLRGRPPRSCRFSVQEEQISVITAMNENGIPAMKFCQRHRQRWWISWLCWERPFANTYTFWWNKSQQYCDIRQLFSPPCSRGRINDHWDWCTCPIPTPVLARYESNWGVLLKGQVTAKEHGNNISRWSWNSHFSRIFMHHFRGL